MPETFLKSSSRVIRAWVVLLVMVVTTGLLAQAQSTVTIPEEIEWTWEVRPAHMDATLPNVLLLGDSITRNYFPEVTKEISGVANVYLMASSTCVGDPRMEHQIAEFAAMEGVHFQVVHFNNGMHGWGYSEVQYQTGFAEFLGAVKKLTTADGALIWTSTTPVRADKVDGATNARVDERNRIALKAAKAAGVSIDDQHELMMHHRDLYGDDVHFNQDGAKLQGQQAAATIRSALKQSAR